MYTESKFVGGMRLVDSNALIGNNLIADNVGYLYGGGIWVQRGAPTIRNNRIENNRIDEAGAVGGGSLPALWDMRVLSPSLSIFGSVANGQMGRVAIADINGDGKADIIVGDGNRVIVIRGSNGTRLATFTGVSASALQALDWNGDGKSRGSD